MTFGEAGSEFPALDVVVVGSANLDMVVSVSRLPRAGETVLASSLREGVGGKGLNQAVAAGRAGATTAFIGVVGGDEGGALITAALDEAGIDRSGVDWVEGPSGRAVVLVDAGGENSILVLQGANARLHEVSQAQAEQIGLGRVMLAQLEIPVEAVHSAAVAARDRSTKVVLNASPAVPLGGALLGLTDLLIVNQHEAQVMLALGDSDASPRAMLEGLLDVVPAVVLTLGSGGSAFASRSGVRQCCPALRVQAVDTTGAGDTFAGALAARLSAGEELDSAVGFATAAAAVSVTRVGAVASIPSRSEVEQLLASGQL